MKQNIIALLVGAVFGFGLCLSQMVNPAVVLGFLDMTGDFDPRLAFVMAGALSVAIPAFRIILRRQAPICSISFAVPKTTVLDRRLILGAMLFGIGWGLAGICPGPAITSLVYGQVESVVFLISMLAGMLLFKLY